MAQRTVICPRSHSQGLSGTLLSSPHTITLPFLDILFWGSDLKLGSLPKCRLPRRCKGSRGWAGASARVSPLQISPAAKSSWRRLLSLSASRASGLLPTRARGTSSPLSPCLGKCFRVCVQVCVLVHVRGESHSCLQFSLEITKLWSKTCVWASVPGPEYPCPSEWFTQCEPDLQILRAGGGGDAGKEVLDSPLKSPQLHLWGDFVAWGLSAGFMRQT